MISINFINDGDSTSHSTSKPNLNVKKINNQMAAKPEYLVPDHGRSAVERVLLGELIEILPNQILYFLCCPQEMFLHSGGSSFKQELPFVDNISSSYIPRRTCL